MAVVTQSALPALKDRFVSLHDFSFLLRFYRLSFMECSAPDSQQGAAAYGTGRFLVAISQDRWLVDIVSKCEQTEFTRQISNYFLVLDFSV